MYSSNPEHDLYKEDYKNSGTLVNSLINHNDDLTSNIGRWQNIIRNTQSGKPNNSERNLRSWYNFAGNSYESDKLKINDRKKRILNEIKDDPNYIFKTIVERVIRELISKELRSMKGMEDKSIKIYNTSEYDDVFSGIDLIIEVEDEKGNKDSLGIDIAVSNNQEYLEEKKNKKLSIPTEFNLSRNKKINDKISREVLPFDPYIISNLINLYLTNIEKGKYIDIIKLYESINRGKSKIDLGSIINSSKQKVNNIIN